MRARSLLHAAQARLQPRRWGAVLALVALVAVARIFVGDMPTAREVPHLAKAYLLILATAALAPVPWQWTGDGRRLAGFWRGMIQALPFNMLWVGLLSLAAAPWRPFLVTVARTGYAPGPAHALRMLHEHLRLPLAVLPGLFLLPATLAVGWVVAALQAATGDRAEALEGRRAMEIAAREAQEQALKAQLDPHVLYNALGGITELVREDPARAEEALVSLAEMYRKLTVLGKRGSVPLGEERALVADYLEVEKVRLGDRLLIRWDWPADLDARSVPPLLVQPLVENAIKHGLAPRKEGGILRLAAAPEGLGLRFTVANDGEPLAPGWTPGTGLSSLTQRLALLGRGSRLELRRDGERTVAELFLRPGGPE